MRCVYANIRTAFLCPAGDASLLVRVWGRWLVGGNSQPRLRSKLAAAKRDKLHCQNYWNDLRKMFVPVLATGVSFLLCLRVLSVVQYANGKKKLQKTEHKKTKVTLLSPTSTSRSAPARPSDQIEL